MKKYYYKTQRNRFNNPICVEQCPLFEKIKIGSENCDKCGNSIKSGFDNLTKGWIMCNKLKENENENNINRNRH